MHADPRGSLIPFNFEGLPFTPRHAFVVRDVPVGTIRGRHVHKSAQQMLVCLAGHLSVEVRDHAESKTVILDRPDLGLVIGAGLWAAQTYLHPETIMLALVSEPYEPGSYVDEPQG